MFSLAFYTFKQDVLLKSGRHLHLNETLWAARHPLNLHGVKTGSEVFILLHISKDARRLRIKFLVHSWPSKFSTLCSSCYIGSHQSLPQWCHHHRGAFVPLWGALHHPWHLQPPANEEGKRSCSFSWGWFLTWFLTPARLLSAQPGITAPTFITEGSAMKIHLHSSDFELLQLHRLLMNPLIREAKQEHQKWAPASSCTSPLQQNQLENYS